MEAKNGDAKPGASSETLFRQACEVIPGGVNSPVRACRAVGTTPRFVARGQGARLLDVDGHGLDDGAGELGAPEAE